MKIGSWKTPHNLFFRAVPKERPTAPPHLLQNRFPRLALYHFCCEGPTWWWEIYSRCIILCHVARCNKPCGWNWITLWESVLFQVQQHHLLKVLTVPRCWEIRERQSADGVSSPEESTLWPPNHSSPSDQSGASDPCWVPWAPSRSGIWSSIWNNEGNNNELKSPPSRKARGHTTYGEFTPDTFHQQLEDPSSERLHSSLYNWMFSS